MDKITHTLTLTVRDVPGMLVRVAQVFSRRGCNIRSLHVEPLAGTIWSVMTIDVQDVPRIAQIAGQLEKLVDVRSVQVAGQGLDRVYDVAIVSPLEPATRLSARLGTKAILKREDLQPVHSFKLRGAYNKISRLSEAERERGVIAASAGNHAQGVALAARKLDLSALIIMPRTTPAIKIEAVKALGAQVELSGDNYSEAAAHAKLRTAETGRTFIHPFDDPLVIAGQGTVGREILDQLPDTTHIFIPTGGGGLTAGIAQYVKSVRPDVAIISVEPEDSNALAASLAAGERVVLPHVGIFADGVAVKQIGERTFDLCRRHVDAAITVSTDEMCAAIKAVFEDTRAIVEPAGALAVAGIAKYAQTHNLSGARAVAVCSGANLNFERLGFVAERTLLGSGQEALFRVSMPERPGALARFCDEVVGARAITQFGYRLSDHETGHVFLGLYLANPKDKSDVIARLDRHGYDFEDLSADDLVKEHIRHMIGGVTPAAHDEQFYEITFPERPGALRDFLRHTQDNWNISLFHYRGMGGDTGRVLIGFEAADAASLEDSLRNTGYEFERANFEAARLFLEAADYAEIS